MYVCAPVPFHLFAATFKLIAAFNPPILNYQNAHCLVHLLLILCTKNISPSALSDSTPFLPRVPLTLSMSISAPYVPLRSFPLRASSSSLMLCSLYSSQLRHHNVICTWVEHACKDIVETFRTSLIILEKLISICGGAIVCYKGGKNYLWSGVLCHGMVCYKDP